MILAGDELRFWTLVWCVAALGQCILRMRSDRPSAGLTVLWVGSLFAINGLPGLVFSVPGGMTPDQEFMAQGMEIAAQAMCAALLGVAVFEMSNRRAPESATPNFESLGEASLGAVLLTLGAAGYLANSLLPRIPTLNAIVSTATWLLPIGILFELRASIASGGRSWLPWGLAAAMTPFVTLASAGFLGHGASLAACVFCFLWALSRRRGRFLPFMILSAYLGLSLFVTYLREREQIRSLVWGGASFAARVDSTANIARNFEFFDAGRDEHRSRVAERLDQVSPIGLARRNLELGTVEYGRGETLWNAVLALIPRAIWPNKPFVAGSEGLMARYTGLTYSEGTSVGITQVMESFVNFGLIGVWTVFGVLGFAVALADGRAGRALLAGDQIRFLKWILPGVAVTNVGGAFGEMTAAAGAGLVVASLLSLVVTRRARQHAAMPRDGWA